MHLEELFITIVGGIFTLEAWLFAFLWFEHGRRITRLEKEIARLRGGASHED